MWDESESQIKNELGASEQLLWHGRPKPGLRLRVSDIILIPFSLMWGGFAIFWEFTVFTSGAPFFFMLFGIPFVVLGIYLIIGRFFVDAKQRSRTWYGLTNERVIIVSGVLSKSVKSLNIDTLSDVTLTEKAGGEGSIAFGVPLMWATWISGSSSRMRNNIIPTFEFIENARPVYELIRQAQQDVKNRGSQSENHGND